MKKSITAWVSVLLCICLFISPLRVAASSTDQAGELIDTSKACSLTLTYTYETLAFPDVAVALYQVATVSSDFQYTATEAFAACGLNFNGIASQDEWNTIRATLANYVASDPALEPTAVQNTDAAGNAVFEGLEPGLYLAAPVQLTQDGFRYYFASVLSALPNLDENHAWIYDVAAKCKPDVENPTGEDIEYKVLKLWKDDGDEENRTESVEIDIIKDGQTVKTVVLSDENNWSYSWYAEDDGSVWSVTERNIPDGYTMTVENRLTTFTVTNSTYTPPPPPPPPTGDTSHIALYVILMCVSGAVLVVLALMQRRKRHE